MIGQILYSSMVYHQIEMKEDYGFEFVLCQNLLTVVTTLPTPFSFPI